MAALFWFFGHPEVYIVAIPFFGIATEVIPVFSRKPLFGYKGMVGATLAIAGLSMTVWAHHMFTTGAVVLLPFFSFMTFLIAVPTGIKFFNWLGTMWRGQLTFDAGMLAEVGPGPEQQPRIYVCGPTPFAETVAEALVHLGHQPQHIKIERFGPTGS